MPQQTQAAGEAEENQPQSPKSWPGQSPQGTQLVPTGPPTPTCGYVALCPGSKHRQVCHTLIYGFWRCAAQGAQADAWTLDADPAPPAPRPSPTGGVPKSHRTATPTSRHPRPPGLTARRPGCGEARSILNPVSKGIWNLRSAGILSLAA